MRILAEKSFAMFIDFQEKLMPAMSKRKSVLERSAMRAQGLNELTIPAILTQQYTKGLGWTVSPLKELLDGAPCFDKASFSCMDDGRINGAVRSMNDLGRNQAIICGVEAHVCVLQTCIDLRAAGYEVALVTDCISSRKPSDKKTALRRAEEEGCLLTTSEAILFELTRTSKNEHFKFISNLVK